MFLRRNRRRKRGQVYEYWTLVESVRTAKGPRQRIVATLGKTPGLDSDERHGWEDIARWFAAPSQEQPSQLDLFENKECEADEETEWANVNLRSVSVERMRDFGKPYLAMALWDRLGFPRFFADNMLRGKEDVSWDQMAFVLCCGRFCAQETEWALAQRWYGSTALEDLIGVAADKVNDDRLYRALDALLPLKSSLFGSLASVKGLGQLCAASNIRNRKIAQHGCRS